MIAHDIRWEMLKSFNYGASFQLALSLWKLMKLLSKKNKNIKLFEDENMNQTIQNWWNGRLANLRPNRNIAQEKKKMKEEIIIDEGHDEMTEEEIREVYNTRLLSYDFVKRRVAYKFTPQKGLGTPRVVHAAPRYRKKPFVMSIQILKILKFGLFLASWSGTTNVLIKHLKCSPLLAGIFSGGLNQALFNGIDYQVALYCAIRAVVSLYFMYGLPTIAPWLAYVLINVVISYFILFDNTFVEPSYRNFLNYLCNNSHESLQYITQVNMSRKGMFQMPFKGQVPPCSPIFHPHSSCSHAFWSRGIETFKRCCKMYSSFYFVTFVLRLSSTIRNGKLMRETKNFFINVGRSAAFIGTQVTIANAGFCLSRNTLDYNSYRINLGMWSLGALGIFFERASRRPELTLFSLWKIALMLIYRVADQSPDYGDFKPIVQRIFSSICLAIATGIWLHLFKINKKSLKSLDALVVNSLFSSSFANTLPSRKSRSK